MSDKERMMGNSDEETPPRLSFFYGGTTQSANEPHRNILHCCQDLYKSILFTSNEYII
jgi:hypothetical protein